ncbi:MAG: hypothetical protein IPN03_17285 [Holophagales bacterium]|nr:hypothetical protein [Holophagales bacterium]
MKSPDLRNALSGDPRGQAVPAAGDEAFGCSIKPVWWSSADPACARRAAAAVLASFSLAALLLEAPPRRRTGELLKPGADAGAEVSQGKEGPVRLLAGEDARPAGFHRYRRPDVGRIAALHRGLWARWEDRNPPLGLQTEASFTEAIRKATGAKVRRRPLLDALFLDRDGTLIAERGFLADPKGVRLAPGASELLARFVAEGTKLFVVTNQSGVARGLTRWAR